MFFLCCQPAIQFVLFERMKGSAALSASHAFFLGAVARAVAVLCTFPFTRARTLIQTRKARQEDGEGERKKTGGGHLAAAGASGARRGISLAVSRVRTGAGARSALQCSDADDQRKGPGQVHKVKKRNLFHLLRNCVCLCFVDRSY